MLTYVVLCRLCGEGDDDTWSAALAAQREREERVSKHAVPN
jgi:hypothetical protein